MGEEMINLISKIACFESFVLLGELYIKRGLNFSDSKVNNIHQRHFATENINDLFNATMG